MIGDDWDVEERSLAALDGLGLGHIGLDRAVGEMSGGECVLLRLAALLLRDPGVLLLDEPTSNLDAYARRRLYDVVDAWTGTLLVVSHDRELLERVDRIADLREGEVTWYGGNLPAYEEALAVEQEAARRTVRAAESDVQRQKRELASAHVTLARRRRYSGQKMRTPSGSPRRRRAAQARRPGVRRQAPRPAHRTAGGGRGASGRGGGCGTAGRGDPDQAAGHPRPPGGPRCCCCATPCRRMARRCGAS
ncbi:hypothetical protein SCALM49S_04690 [Streptomyces californicus]